VKNITDFGAFVDLEGMDGLLHITDMSWGRVTHPSEMVRIGQPLEVQILEIDKDKERVSLGLKQMSDNPWQDILAKYPIGKEVSGKVTKLLPYGAFVELEGGIEGLVHVSEMSWTKKNVHPNKIVSKSEEVEVVVLEVDTEKRRISLGIKQAQENPWDGFAAAHKAGDELEGPINNITEFGMFVGVGHDIDGMVHMSDISWEDGSEDALKAYEKGQTVKVKLLDIDADNERVALGIKQLGEDPFQGAMDGVTKGAVVTGTITDIKATLVHVSINESVSGTIKKIDLSRERSEQRTDRFAVGEKVDALVISVDGKSRKVGLSIKAHEIAQDKQALEEFGSTESGASLGDILGAALKDDK